MTGRSLCAARAWHRRNAAAGAAAAAVAAALLGSACGAISSPHSRRALDGASISEAQQVAAGPRSDMSGTPSGWAPVAYRQAQLSVPSAWLVESPQQVFCQPDASGMIFVGTGPRFPAGTACRPAARLAWIGLAGHIPPGLRHRKPTAVIHGIPVYRLRTGPHSVLYLVPALGARIGAKGPLARRVLSTLTWSPLAVVLRHGSEGPVPASWTWHRFGSIKFAVPRAWKVERQHQWATCGTGVVPQSLLLVNATLPPLRLPCPYPMPTAAADQAQPGLTVVTGKYASQSVSEDFVRCQLRSGARICLSSTTGQGGSYNGVLIFSVSPPHKRAATFLLLGLYGSGIRARAIFDSIRTARR